MKRADSSAAVPTGTMQIKLKATNGVAAPQNYQSMKSILVNAFFKVAPILLGVLVFCALLQRSTVDRRNVTAEGCDKTKIDVDAYLSKYPDILAWIEDWTEKEYLKEHPAAVDVPLSFNPREYWDTHPSAMEYVQAWTLGHFNTYGISEGRHSCPVHPSEDKGADAAAIDHYAHVALRHQAASAECGRVRRLLLAFPVVEVDRTDAHGLSALHYAASAGASDCVRMLLVAGASSDNLAQSGHNPAAMARHHGHDHIVKQLEWSTEQ